jgi:hypothetical protein
VGYSLAIKKWNGEYLSGDGLWAGPESGRGAGRERGSECVETQLAIKVAACASVEFIESGNGAENPSGVHGFAERFEFLGERQISQNRFLYFGRKLQEIGEQAVEDGDLIFEGRFAVLGKS